MAKQAYTWRQPPYPGDASDTRWIDPSILVLCQDADIDSSIQPLLRTLYEPIGVGLVAAVFVHETLREKFIGQVRDNMQVVHRQVKKHAFYIRALRRVRCLSAELVSMLTPDDIDFQYTMAEGSPLMVCDFNQSYFSSAHPSTVVTLHTFRHSQELLKLVTDEKLPFVSAAIWSPKTTTAYEIGLMLNISTIYINCAEIPLMHIAEQFHKQEPYVLLMANHHFEVVMHQDKPKAIVYPAPLWENPQSEQPASESSR